MGDIKVSPCIESQSLERHRHCAPRIQLDSYSNGPHPLTFDLRSYAPPTRLGHPPRVAAAGPAPPGGPAGPPAGRGHQGLPHPGPGPGPFGGRGLAAGPTRGGR